VSAAGPGWPALRVRIGQETVSAQDEAAVDAAIGRANRGEAIEGLADALNPRLIDPARAHAFLAALMALPLTELQHLGGHSLYLAAPGLPLRMTSPTTPASFLALKGLADPDIQGDTVLATARLQPDCDLAQTQSTSARQALDAIADAIVTQTSVRQAATGTAEAPALEALSILRRKRARIAAAWNENARAAAVCAPQNAAAQREQEAARKAASEFALP
jgi:hypothetical protein